MLKLMEGIRSILEACVPIKTGEHVLIIAYNEGKTMWLGQLIMGIIESMGAETVLTIMAPRKISWGEPPVSVAAAMKNVDTIIQVCEMERASYTHTTARKEATDAGIKFVHFNFVPLDDLKRGISSAEYRIVKERTERIAEILQKANVARIATPFGTNLTMSLAGRESMAINPMGPVIYPLPYYAEAAITPVEGTAEGTVVTDLSIRGWGYMLREPIRFIVKAGKVTEILGSTPDADRLRKIVATDENANNFAELGIGTCHIIPGVMQGRTWDFARLGTVHFGIGRNNDIGGNTWSRIHQDVLMSQATIDLDNVCIMKEGALLL